jgi:hypothetical protein
VIIDNALTICPPFGDDTDTRILITYNSRDSLSHRPFLIVKKSLNQNNAVPPDSTSHHPSAVQLRLNLLGTTPAHLHRNRRRAQSRHAPDGVLPYALGNCMGLLGLLGEQLKVPSHHPRLWRNPHHQVCAPTDMAQLARRPPLSQLMTAARCTLNNPYLCAGEAPEHHHSADMLMHVLAFNSRVVLPPYRSH